MQEVGAVEKPKRITLPNYTLGEEITNAITHGIGAVLGIVAIILLAIKVESTFELVVCVAYGLSIITTYTISTVYHALKKCDGKRVMRVLDHCFIYLLIIGTYMPFCLITLRDIGGVWYLCAVVLIAAFGVTFTAIDVKKYRYLSMACYLIMGWCIVLAGSKILMAIPTGGFVLLLAGGIVYTVGAVVYAFGSKMRYIHSLWHLFVLGGSICHFLSILIYVI
ncbi:MAG: hemolysin III family protein [Bacillota bacterium]